MIHDPHSEILREAVDAGAGIVRALARRPGDAWTALSRLAALQDRFCAEFPAFDDEVAFWETLWTRTDRLRDQWLRVEKFTARRQRGEAVLQPLLDARRADLYEWTRRTIVERAPRVPEPAHFELGLGPRRADCRGLHERIEGLYESVKRTGALPELRDDVVLPAGDVNFGIVYGGGWNVSSYSVLRATADIEGLTALVAFDHGGVGLFGAVGEHRVRLAPAGLVRCAEDGCERWTLATFREPAVLHFVCPHAWTGPSPVELGVPVLRSHATLDIVNDKLATTRTLAAYAAETGADLPLIPERGLAQAEWPADAEALRAEARRELDALARDGVREVCVKPASGEQSRGVAFFVLPDGMTQAAEHAAALALESGVVMQERVRPAADVDFNWRVLVALGPDGGPHVVGRFARRVAGEDVEMVEEHEMLARAGVAGEAAGRFLARLDRVSLDAFRAVAAAGEGAPGASAATPLGGGTYGTPYLLGIDLIGEAFVMEVNGNEVAGMWTDDRLHPETRGRSSRPMLEAARQAARRYREALGAGRYP